jgi:predicted RND superfamily exporter protein
MDASDQLGSAVLLGIVLAVGLVLFFLAAWLVRVAWRWMVEGSSQRTEQKQEPKPEVAQPSGVSASDLFVIRSNLNAVARQVEDLERRLRLERPGRATELVSPRD